MRSNRIVMLGATLLLSGCVAPERELRIDQDLATLNSRLTVVERNLSGQAESQATNARQSRELTERLEAMAKRQADLLAKEEALRVELQTLRGQIDDSAARRREQQDAQTLVQQDAALRLGNLDSRLGKLEKEMAEVRASLAQAASAPVAADPEQLYEQGRALVQKKEDPARGRILLEDFIKQHPRSDLVPNALYWIGEAYYSEKNYEGAILQFQDVLEKYPTYPKAAAALYKQALAFEALGESKKAKALLQKLTEVYPKSEEAQKARTQLEKMKK